MTLISLLLALFLLSSCGEKSASYTKLQNSYDSLLVQNTRNKQDLEEVLTLMMQVEDEIQKVAIAENRVRVGYNNGDLTEDNRQEILQDITFLTESLKANKEELAKQMEMLKKKDLNINALNKKINNLQRQIVEKETIITELKTELAARDLTIREQGEKIEGLQETTRTHETTIGIQDKQLREQDQKLHEAYYCFGTVSELKEQKILSGGGLFSKAKVLPEGFNKDYFIKIDTRNISTIQLFAPKALLRTDHPTSSYELVKDRDGNMTLKILDQEEFWSRSKYLVVEITL